MFFDFFSRYKDKSKISEPEYYDAYVLQGRVNRDLIAKLATLTAENRALKERLRGAEDRLERIRRGKRVKSPDEIAGD